jgi:putative transposase
MKKSIIKPKNVSYARVPGKLWRKIKKYFPKQQVGGKGRPACPNRAVMDGIWYVMWSGCQWKSIERGWFGVCSSVLHARFQTWQRQGVFVNVVEAMLRYYGRARHIRWDWQSADCRAVPAPYRGTHTGPNPTDRAKAGGKIHLLVDQRGAPLAVSVFGANHNEKWHIAALLCMILVQRPTSIQHLCLDKAYDSWEVHVFVKQQGYDSHIKHRRRVNEPKDPCPIPGETQYPPRRWVVERTFAWLGHRRSIRIRWCRKAQNWLAFLHLACAHILFDFAFYG